MAIAFGEHILDVERRELWRAGAPVALEPQVFDLLVYLVRHRDRVARKDDLWQAVWGGRIVSDAALTTRINAVRRALGDDGKAQHLIRTLPRHGYRFVAEATELPGTGTPAPTEMSGEPAARPPSAAAARNPTIAMLPLAAVDGSDSQGVAAGISEQLVIALSRIRWLGIVCLDTGFSRPGSSLDVGRLSCELGARYLLQGAVHQNCRRLRITARLAEIVSGLCLWADCFDGGLDDGFPLQDEIAARIAGAIEPAVQTAEVRRSLASTNPDPTPFDLHLQAQPIFSDGRHAAFRSLALLDRALALDPDFSPALADAALCRQILDINSWTADRQTNRCEALDLARRALHATEGPQPLATAAHVLAYFGENIDAALALIDHAVALNPSLARGWFASGMIRLYAGQPDEASEHFERSLQLNPHDRIGRRNVAGLGIAHFFNRRFEEAIPRLRTALEEFPRWATPYGALASCYWQTGLLGDARATVARLKAADPALAPSVSQFRNPKHRDLLTPGLGLAGA